MNFFNHLSPIILIMMFFINCSVAACNQKLANKINNDLKKDLNPRKNGTGAKAAPPRGNDSLRLPSLKKDKPKSGKKSSSTKVIEKSVNNNIVTATPEQQEEEDSFEDTRSYLSATSSFSGFDSSRFVESKEYFSESPSTSSNGGCKPVELPKTKSKNEKKIKEKKKRGSIARKLIGPLPENLGQNPSQHALEEAYVLNKYALLKGAFDIAKKIAALCTNTDDRLCKITNKERENVCKEALNLLRGQYTSTATNVVPLSVGKCIQRVVLLKSYIPSEFLCFKSHENLHTYPQMVVECPIYRSGFLERDKFFLCQGIDDDDVFLLSEQKTSDEKSAKGTLFLRNHLRNIISSASKSTSK